MEYPDAAADLTSTLYLQQLHYHTEDDISSDDASTATTPTVVLTDASPTSASLRVTPDATTVALTDATPQPAVVEETITLNDATVSLTELAALPAAAAITEAQMEVSTLLP